MLTQLPFRLGIFSPFCPGGNTNTFLGSQQTLLCLSFTLNLHTEIPTPSPPSHLPYFGTRENLVLYFLLHYFASLAPS